MKRNDTIYETAKFYKDKNISVHITLASGKWFNGLIKQLSEKSLVLDEEKFGVILILFERIIDDGIEPREDKK